MVTTLYQFFLARTKTVTDTSNSTPSERTGQSDVENEPKKSSLESVGPPMAARSNVLIFLITLGDYLPEKPWFVRVNRHASRRSIASDYFVAPKT